MDQIYQGYVLQPMPVHGLLKATAKRILSKNILLPLFKGRRFIFLFHDISEPTAAHHSHHYSVTPTQFKEILAFLKKQFRFLPLEELVSETFSCGDFNCASLAFNDGFFSTLELAYPVLLREGIPFAQFVNKNAVVTNQGWITNVILGQGDIPYLERVWKRVLATPIGFETFQKDPVNALLQGGMRIENRELLYDQKFGEKKIYADENDVRFLHANGVLIGSHASSHFVLSQCPLDEVQRLARENRLFLEGLLNTRIEHFSIPFGKKEHYNEQVLDCLQKEYKYIYNSNPDMVPPPGEFNPRCIPQISFANAGLREAIFYLNRTFVTRVDI